jgi:hypothetical protein
MHLFRMYWQRVLRRPGSVLIWLAVPFVFMAIYTMVFGNDNSGPPKTTMAVVDQDSSLVSKVVKSALQPGPDSKDAHNGRREGHGGRRDVQEGDGVGAR